MSEGGAWEHMAVRLWFAHTLYIHPELEDVRWIQEGLKRQDSFLGVYLICINENGHHLMEIIHSVEIFKTIYQRHHYMVIGLANGKENACDLVLKILKEHWKECCSLMQFKKKIMQKH